MNALALVPQAPQSAPEPDKFAPIPMPAKQAFSDLSASFARVSRTFDGPYATGKSMADADQLLADIVASATAARSALRMGAARVRR